MQQAFDFLPVPPATPLVFYWTVIDTAWHPVVAYEPNGIVPFICEECRMHHCMHVRVIRRKVGM